MIEIIYKDDSEKNNTDTVIKLPKNIRQIGEGGLDTQIYIEDNIMNYLNKVPLKENDIRYGILLGTVKKGYGYTYIFINGAIDVEDIIENTVIFTDEIWTSINDNIRRYFNNLKVVGWFTSLNYAYNNDMPYINKIHLDNFAGLDKVYMRIDRIENEEAFYIYGSGGLKKQPGYHIYYDKNYNMEDYIYGSNISRYFNDGKTSEQLSRTYIGREANLKSDKRDKNGKYEKNNKYEKNDKYTNDEKYIRDEKNENNTKSGKYGIEENTRDKKVMNAESAFKTLSKNIASIAMILMLAGTVALVTNENAMDRVRAKIAQVIDGSSSSNSGNGHDIPVVGIVNETESSGTTSEVQESSELETTSGNESSNEKGTTNKKVASNETQTTSKKVASDKTETTSKIEASSESASKLEVSTEITNKIEVNNETTSKSESSSETETTKESNASEELETPTASVSAETLNYYKVKQGDTLIKIAKRLYGDESVVKDIMKLNNITDGDYIKEGDKLIVP